MWAIFPSYDANVNVPSDGVAYGFNVNSLSIILDRNFKALNTPLVGSR